MEPQQNYQELIMRQLERLDDRTRNLATREDLEALRKDLVAREALEPRLTALTSQIERVNKDRIEDKETLAKRIDNLEKEPMSRQDRLMLRLTQIAALLGLILAGFEFLSHLRFLP